MKKSLILILSALLLVFPAVSLYSCAYEIKAQSLMDGVRANEVEKVAVSDEFKAAQMAFALELLLGSAKTNGGENTMVSPLSVTLALAMTANGAGGNTLSEMEKVLGGELTIDELNKYLYSYVEGLPSEKKCELGIANSIWFRDSESLTVKRDFLQKNADYYGADAYKAPFDDATVKDINSWVKSGTKGMIEKIIDGKIDPDTMLYLINTVAFEAEWADKYTEDAIHKRDFTSADGKKQNVDMLFGAENRYIELENATGFMKPYVGGNYSFAALLPSEGMTPEELLATLDGSALNAALVSPQRQTVHTMMPAFEAEFDTELSDILKGMGMVDAFDGGSADFKAMGECSLGNLYIGRVLHKTYIKVDASGTKAGAVTAVEMNTESAMPPEEIKQVYLDRPFLYMIVDNSTGLPIFFGILNSVE